MEKRHTEERLRAVRKLLEAIRDRGTWDADEGWDGEDSRLADQALGMLDDGDQPILEVRNRIAFLLTSRPKLIDYLRLKLEAEDWRRCQDAASDLRDLDSEVDGLRY
jgi:hypothetical protein